MNNLSEKEYGAIIGKLLEDLKNTESVAQKLYALIKKNSSDKETLLRLEDEYRTQISSLLFRSAKLYRGRIKILPFPENADISQRKRLGCRDLVADVGKDLLAVDLTVGREVNVDGNVICRL